GCSAARPTRGACTLPRRARRRCWHRARVAGGLRVSMFLPLLPPEDERAHVLDARAAGDEADLGVLHLITRCAPDLPHGFRNRLKTRDRRCWEVAATRVDGKLAVRPFDTAALNEGTALALFAEAVVLDRHEHERCEVLIELRHVHLRGADAGHLPE